MKPVFLDQIEESFAVHHHGILDFNTTDRYYWPEQGIGPLSLTYFLAKHFRGQGYRVAEYVPANGLIELHPEGKDQDKTSPFRNLSGQQDPVAVIGKIISLMRQKEDKWLFIIHYGEHLTPRESIGVSASTMPGQVHALELLHRLSFDDAIAGGQSRVLIITYTDLPAELITKANGYNMIRIDLPSFDERLAFIDFMEQLSESRPDRFGGLAEGLDRHEFAAITAGMPLIGIESLYLSAGFSTRPINRENVRERKAKSIAQLAQDLLEVSEPQIGFSDVAGAKHVIEFLQRLLCQIRAGHAGVPQALLFQGPPGSGKTHLSQAMAHELGWPLVQFRSVRGPYVGQSEQRLELIITIVEQLQPAVLLFDEIDQLIGQRGTGASGDSGTSERMIARIFNWLGDMAHRGKILFIGTSNRPDILDAALLDRFKISIPILNPTTSDLLELIPLTLKRLERDPAPDVDFAEITQALSPLNPSGRALQEIMIHAGLVADHESGMVGSQIGKEHLLRAAYDYLPIEDPLEMEFIFLNSLAMCSANSFLPWMGIDGRRPDAEIP